MGAAGSVMALALVFVIACFATATQAADDGSVRSSRMMPAASSGDHLWFCAEVQNPRAGYLLCHVDLRQSPPALTTVADSLILAHPPQAMAAWGDRVWLVTRPIREQRRQRREVFTVRVARNQAMGVNYFLPHDRLEMAPELSGQGNIGGMVGSAEGPIVLLVPLQRDLAGVEANNQDGDAPARMVRPQLLRLTADAWQSLDLPEEMAADPEALLATGGPGGEWLQVFTRGPDSTQILVHRRDRSGTWISAPVPFALSSLLGATNVGSQTALVLRISGQQDRMMVSYLRDGLLLPLAELAIPDPPDHRWAIEGAGDQLRLVTTSPKGGLSIAAIDGISGAVAPAQPLAPGAHPARRMVFLPILLMVGLTAVVGGVLFKPSPQAAAVKLPRDQAVAGPMPRLVGLMIDLIPGAVLTMLWFKADLATVTRVPSLALTFEQAVPALLVIGITLVHETISELLTGRTIGKVVAGIQVVSNDGGRVGPLAVITRNFFKFLTLCIPPLAIFALLNPNMKGIGDTLGRTLVVADADEDRNGRGGEVDDGP